MAEHEPKKDFTKVDPENLDLTIKGEPPEDLPGSSVADPSQTGHFSGKPPANSPSAELPEVEPDNMPGNTEVDNRIKYQRY
jgi:hypothetical protein